MLSSTDTQAHILPNIKHSLVSIKALCGEGCMITFRIKYVTVIYKKYIILQGWRNHHNIFWYFPISIDNEDEQVGNNKNNPVNNIYDKKTQE